MAPGGERRFSAGSQPGMAREAGVKRAVYVSIVGMEGAAFPYYRGKLAAEAVVSSSV